MSTKRWCSQAKDGKQADKMCENGVSRSKAGTSVGTEYQAMLATLTFAVMKKCSKPSGLRLVSQRHQEGTVELKCTRKLLQNLPHTVQELKKYGGTLVLGKKNGDQVEVKKNSMVPDMCLWTSDIALEI